MKKIIIFMIMAVFLAGSVFGADLHINGSGDFTDTIQYLPPQFTEDGNNVRIFIPAMAPVLKICCAGLSFESFFITKESKIFNDDGSLITNADKLFTNTSILLTNADKLFTNTSILLTNTDKIFAINWEVLPLWGA
jgi:hypothetical protein